MNPSNTQALLEQLRQGDAAAAERLFPVIYRELHQLASQLMGRERQDHTLQPTALIHEAFLKLSGMSTPPDFADNQHFMATAARVMRQVLINHAVARKAQKRDAGDRQQIPLDTLVQTFERDSIDLLDLDEALQELSQLDPLQHQLVELKFFAGLPSEECASILRISTRRLYYEWAHVRAWLRRRLTEPESPGEDGRISSTR